MKKKTDIDGKDETLIDIPVLVISGASIGFLFDGVFFSTMGFFIAPHEGSIGNWFALGVGLIIVALSAALALFGWAYWKFIAQKKGELFPRLLGFGLIPTLMAFFSALVVGTELSYWLTLKLSCAL